MKKRKILVLVLAVLLLLSLLSACGDGETNLVTYENEGLSINMPKGYEESDLDGFTCFYQSENGAMCAVKEDYDLFISAGLDPNGVTIEEYIEMVKSANGIKDDFEKNENGNYYITYEKEIDGNEIFYYTTVRKGNEAFWVVNLFCFAEDKDEYLPQFESWGDTIVVK